MNWRFALVFLVALALVPSTSAWSQKTDAAQAEKAAPAGAFDQIVKDANPAKPSGQEGLSPPGVPRRGGFGKDAGSGNSGGYGAAPPSGSGGGVQAGMPGFGAPGAGNANVGLGQFNPDPAPVGPPGGQPQGGGPNRPQAAQNDLAQIINGVWRVQFSNGGVMTMTWRYDPQRGTFFDGQKECQVQVSGYTMQVSGQNSYTGAQQVLTIQFVSPTEARGTLGVQSAPNIPNSAVYLQLYAVKIG